MNTVFEKFKGLYEEQKRLYMEETEKNEDWMSNENHHLLEKSWIILDDMLQEFFDGNLTRKDLENLEVCFQFPKTKFETYHWMGEFITRDKYKD